MPDDVARALKRATILEWVTIGYLLIDLVLVVLFSGNSRAIQAAWVQDLLGMAPPLAFLVTVRLIARRGTRKHPYGFHQSFDVAYLFATLALLLFGGLLLVQSAMSLIQGEHPTIGTVLLFGESVWLGWFMVAVMARAILPPLILGRMEMKLAVKVHKMLYADAQVNKADWMSSVAAVLGILGIGLGVWWADAVPQSSSPSTLSMMEPRICEVPCRPSSMPCRTGRAPRMCTRCWVKSKTTWRACRG